MLVYHTLYSCLGECCSTSPAILDLPDHVLHNICTVLDSSAQHNWQRLVEYVPDYTHTDVMELQNVAQQVRCSGNYTPCRHHEVERWMQGSI